MRCYLVHARLRKHGEKKDEVLKICLLIEDDNSIGKELEMIYGNWYNVISYKSETIQYYKK